MRPGYLLWQSWRIHTCNLLLQQHASFHYGSSNLTSWPVVLQQVRFLSVAAGSCTYNVLVNFLKVIGSPYNRARKLLSSVQSFFSVSLLVLRQSCHSGLYFLSCALVVFLSWAKWHLDACVAYTTLQRQWRFVSTKVSCCVPLVHSNSNY